MDLREDELNAQKIRTSVRNAVLGMVKDNPEKKEKIIKIISHEILAVKLGLRDCELDDLNNLLQELG